MLSRKVGGRLALQKYIRTKSRGYLARESLRWQRHERSVFNISAAFSLPPEHKRGGLINMLDRERSHSLEDVARGVVESNDRHRTAHTEACREQNTWSTP